MYGIGTNVGKTHTICNVVSKLKLEIKENFAIKPLISGFRMNDYRNTDNYKLLKALNVKNLMLVQVLEISKYVFTDELSVDIASWNEDVKIDFAEVINFL